MNNTEKIKNPADIIKRMHDRLGNRSVTSSVYNMHHLSKCAIDNGRCLYKKMNKSIRK